MTLDTVSMGETGLEVSELVFGTWRFGRETDQGNLEIDRETGQSLLSAYADAGGRFVDTADVYGAGTAETWIGEWLADRDRDDYVLASKVFWPTAQDDPNRRGLNRKHLRRQVEAILDRLDTDYLDVLYAHRWDDQTPARELMRTLDGFVDDGRVHYLGTSTLRPNAWKIARANELARERGWEPFTVTQPRYNLVNREIEAEYLEFCRDQGLAVFPWSPLAQGFLTGKYTREGDQPHAATASDTEGWDGRYLTEANFDALDVLREVAADVDATLPQVALAWQLHRADVTAPIVGARTLAQLEENLGATAIDLSTDQVTRLDDAKPGPYADLL